MERKHTTTQNVLAAVDFDLCFYYVLAGWERSAHDALILADALERDDGLRVPPGTIESPLFLRKKSIAQFLFCACLVMSRQVLPCRCWVCCLAWVPATLSRHKISSERIWS